MRWTDLGVYRIPCRILCLADVVTPNVGRVQQDLAPLAAKAKIQQSTFHLWKQKGEEQKTGRFSAFSAHLEKTEADFRARCCRYRWS